VSTFGTELSHPDPALRMRPLVLRPRIAPGVLLSGGFFCTRAAPCDPTGIRARRVPSTLSHWYRGLWRTPLQAMSASIHRSPRQSLENCNPALA